MFVKSIRGAIQYNGTIYPEGKEFEMQEEHFKQVQENVEVILKESQENTEQTSRTDRDLSKLTVPELSKIAEEQGVEVKSNWNKATILKAIAEKF